MDAETQLQHDGYVQSKYIRPLKAGFYLTAYVDFQNFIGKLGQGKIIVYKGYSEWDGVQWHYQHESYIVALRFKQDIFDEASAIQAKFYLPESCRS